MSQPPKHRGLAPRDAELFGKAEEPRLRSAAGDLCWLLDRGYAARSAVDLVGNRHSLAERQRLAIARCACSREQASHRLELRVDPRLVRGEELWLDGYNVLTVIESALAGGIVLLGRDGCCRDIAGIHRRYRKVSETLPALQLVGEITAAWGVSVCRWFLDQPVSNSGRLKAAILETASGAGWNMAVELTFSPDHVLSHTPHVIATSDGAVLDRCRRWVNLARRIIEERIPSARVVELGLAGEERV